LPEIRSAFILGGVRGAMSDIIINNVPGVNQIKSSDLSKRNSADGFREGYTYRGKVTGFAEGSASVTVNNRQFMVSADTGLHVGQELYLKLIKRDADGKLIFKLLGGDSQAGTVRTRSGEELLKSLGLKTSSKELSAALDSFMKFGLRLDAKSLERVSAAVSKLSQSPEMLSRLGKMDPKALFDVGTLLQNSKVPINADTLAAGLLIFSNFEKFGGDFSKLFSLAPLQMAAELQKALPDIEKRNKKTADSAKKIIDNIKKTSGKDGISLIRDLGKMALQGGAAEEVPGEAGKSSLAEEIIGLAGQLSDFEKDEGRGRYIDAIGLCLEFLDNYAAMSLYGVMSQRYFTKLPFRIDNEDREALLEVEKTRNGTVSVDVFVSMTKVGSVRVNFKKKGDALGICFFVGSKRLQKFFKNEYDSSSGIWDGMLQAPGSVSFVAGERRDFIPGVFRFIHENYGAGDFNLSA